MPSPPLNRPPLIRRSLSRPRFRWRGSTGNKATKKRPRNGSTTRRRPSRKAREFDCRTRHGCLDRGRPALARTEIDQAKKLDPDLKDAEKVRALVSWYLRDLAGAEAILEPMHHDAPADSVVANLLALTLIEQDDKAKQSRGLQLADVNAQQFPRSPEIQATLRLGALPRWSLGAGRTEAACGCRWWSNHSRHRVLSRPRLGRQGSYRRCPKAASVGHEFDRGVRAQRRCRDAFEVVDQVSLTSPAILVGLSRTRTVALGHERASKRRADRLFEPLEVVEVHAKALVAGVGPDDNLRGIGQFRID